MIKHDDILYFLRHLLFLILLFDSSIVSRGQNQDTLMFNTLDDLKLDVPTLDVLIDSAINFAPQVDYRSLEVKIAERELRTKRWEWLRYIYLQGNYQYGNLQNFAVAYDEEANVSDNVTVTTQNRYSFGVSANLPISSLWNRQNQNKIAKLKKDQAVREYEMEKQGIRQLVIELYSELLLEHEGMIIANSNQQSTKLQMMMAKKQFASGQMLLIDYANMKQLELKAEQEFSSAKINFGRTKALLIEIVGFKF